MSAHRRTGLDQPFVFHRGFTIHVGLAEILTDGDPITSGYPRRDIVVREGRKQAVICVKGRFSVLVREMVSDESEYIALSFSKFSDC